MTARIAVPLLCALVLTVVPAVASQPSGTVAELIANARGPVDLCFPLLFELIGGQYRMSLDPTDTVTLEMAIIPFASGATDVGIDQGPDSVTAVSLIFEDGLVNGIRYNRNRWNDLTVTLFPDRQEYEMTLNGQAAGPFPYNAACEGGCLSLNAFRINADYAAGGSVAWIDSVSIVRHSATGSDLFFGLDAELCSYPPYVAGGGIVFTNPPQPHQRTKRVIGTL